jgi:Pentapeptide repeats (9 copies)
MKKMLIIPVVVFSALAAIGQKTVNAEELLSQLTQGKAMQYEDVTIVGDLDLSRVEGSKLTGQYPENGKTVAVYTIFVRNAVSFKHCKFAGRFILCGKTETSTEKKEYRVEFSGDVEFLDCIFEKATDFELANFNKAVSLTGSTFKEQPRFVRMGLYQKPNVDGLTLEKGCLFQFDQSKKAQVFSSKELTKMVDTMK